MISDTQMPPRYRGIIDEQVRIYNEGRSIANYDKIPDTTVIPITDPHHWYKVRDVVCVFVDMRGSTQLSAVNHDKSTAGAYQLFTSTAVRIFDAFEAPYIDVKGDGVFAMFNYDQVYRALAAAVTFKTFARDIFVPTIKTDTQIEVGSHIGIDQKTVLVRKIGIKRIDGRTDRQNEVWAGKPVNMASKLASIGNDGDLLVSDRYFQRLKDDHAVKSCGCVDGQPTEVRKDLWTVVDVSDKPTPEKPMFDFPVAYRLASYWCPNHGNEFCCALLEADKA